MAPNPKMRLETQTAAPPRAALSQLSSVPEWLIGESYQKVFQQKSAIGAQPGNPRKFESSRC